MSVKVFGVLARAYFVLNLRTDIRRNAYRGYQDFLGFPRFKPYPEVGQRPRPSADDVAVSGDRTNVRLCNSLYGGIKSCARINENAEKNREYYLHFTSSFLVICI